MLFYSILAANVNHVGFTQNMVKIVFLKVQSIRPNKTVLFTMEFSLNTVIMLHITKLQFLFVYTHLL
jgi:hypothetical protein